MVNIYKQIVKKIKEYDEIVIARHIGPDPDAIGSEIALRDLIKHNFPNKKVYAVGAGVSRFKYLGVLDKVDESKLTHALLIIVDVPTFERVDSAYLPRYDYSIKIDHHPCDHKVCDLELVDTKSSSVCQLITELIYKTKLKITDEIASKLYLGIVADSDRFLLSYTTPKTLELSAKLLNDYNIDLMTLYNNLYERGLDERRFEAYITNMVNDFNFIKEIKVWAFSSYDEKNEQFKINIRSRGIIVNEVASKFNGGGHKFASGARLKTESEVDDLFNALDELCKIEKQKEE